jgi:hypothetical protein
MSGGVLLDLPLTHRARQPLLPELRRARRDGIRPDDDG